LTSAASSTDAVWAASILMPENLHLPP
jgi:hypothetical protein